MKNKLKATKKKFHKLISTKKNFTNLDPRRIESIGQRQTVKWSGGIKIWHLCRVLIQNLRALGGSELREDWERERERHGLKGIGMGEGKKVGGVGWGMDWVRTRKEKERRHAGMGWGMRENLKRKGKEEASRVRKRETGTGHACERQKI